MCCTKLSCLFEVVAGSSRAAGGIGDVLLRPGPHDFDDGFDQITGREVLDRACLHIFGVPLQQPFVDASFYVYIETGPSFGIDHADEAMQQMIGRLPMLHIACLATLPGWG